MELEISWAKDEAKSQESKSHRSFQFSDILIKSTFRKKKVTSTVSQLNLHTLLFVFDVLLFVIVGFFSLTNHHKFSSSLYMFNRSRPLHCKKVVILIPWTRSTGMKKLP